MDQFADEACSHLNTRKMASALNKLVEWKSASLERQERDDKVDEFYLNKLGVSMF
jgi:hypothetical protein